MVVLSMYPVAPATIQPKARPAMILIFFMNGDPKISVNMMETKDRKPRPMNSGDPHLDMNRSTPTCPSRNEKDERKRSRGEDGGA